MPYKLMYTLKRLLHAVMAASAWDAPLVLRRVEVPLDVVVQDHSVHQSVVEGAAQSKHKSSAMRD